MATGGEVRAKPLYDVAVLTVQRYNPSLEQVDKTVRRPLGPLVVDSSLRPAPALLATTARVKGGFERSFNKNPLSNGNKRLRSFYDIFYERVHFDPAVLRLGQLLNAQSREVSVWNAFFESRTLEAMTETNGEGLDFMVGELPQVFRPLQEKVYTVSVSIEGPPTIDATYTFQWDHAVVQYKVTGERIVVLAFPPSPTAEFVERFTWYGTITTAYSGYEQRMSLSEGPRVSYDFRLQVLDEELQLFDSVMWGWQSRAFAVPIWNSYTYTSQAVGMGGTTLYVEETADREFAPDQLAVIYAGSGMYESVEVQQVYADRLILKKPLARSWSRRVSVLPVRTMRMGREIAYTGPVANFREVSMSLIAEASELVPAATWPTNYLGRPVLNFSPDMSGGISGTYNRNMDWDDGQYSLPWIVDKSGVGTPKQVWQFTWDSYVEVQRFKALLAALYGTQGTFWASTWAPDMTAIAEIPQGATSFYVNQASFSAMYFDPRGRSHIVILLRDGTQYYREILSITPGSGAVPNSELVTIDAPIPRRLLPYQIACISFLTLSRFENESFEFKWTTQGWITMSAMIKGLTDGI